MKTKETYLERVSNVMKDKYRLFDKFVVVSAYFADDNVDELIEKFQNIKKKRDEIFHGDEVNEDSLPLYEVIELFKNYFKNHLLRK